MLPLTLDPAASGKKALIKINKKKKTNTTTNNPPPTPQNPVHT